MSRNGDTSTILITPGGGPGVLAIIHAARTSRRRDFRIILADANPAAGNLYLPEVSKAYRLPPYDATGYLDALIRLIRSEKVDYFYAGLDEELPLLSASRQRFLDEGCRQLLPPEEPLKQAIDKAAMWELLRTTVRQPNTFIVDEGFDSNAAFEACGGSVVIKATSLRGGRCIWLPVDREEYDFRIHRTLRLYEETGARFIVQQRIVGDEYNVTSLHDADARPVYAISRRKFERREIKSTTTSAVVEERRDVIDLALAAVGKMELTPGFNNTEIIVDARSDLPYLIEINGGRCAAQDENIVASGINVIDLMVDILDGRTPERVPHPSSRLASLKIRRDVIVPYDTIESVPAP